MNQSIYKSINKPSLVILCLVITLIVSGCEHSSGLDPGIGKSANDIASQLRPAVSLMGPVGGGFDPAVSTDSTGETFTGPSYGTDGDPFTDGPAQTAPQVTEPVQEEPPSQTEDDSGDIQLPIGP